MWHIEHPVRVTSADFKYKTFQRTGPKFYFYLSDAEGKKLAHGQSTVSMDPDPLWSHGFRIKAERIFYMSRSTFEYVEYAPVSDRPL